MANGEFAGRTLLVTGGSRGIGRAVCLRLAGTGARIAFNYASDTAAAEKTLAELEATGAACRMYRADVADLDQTADMFKRIEADLGPVDLLVANAGIARKADAADMSAEVWREIMSVNLDGTFHTVWCAKDGMLARGFGRIVCISSVTGLVANPIAPQRLIAYGTSKAAIIGFTRNCARAFGPDVRVNCVAPGVIETEMTADITDDARAQMLAGMSLKRFGQPEEIAEMVHFLLSERSSYTTGQTFVASGGLVTLP